MMSCLALLSALSALCLVAVFFELFRVSASAFELEKSALCLVTVFFELSRVSASFKVSVLSLSLLESFVRLSKMLSAVSSFDECC